MLMGLLWAKLHAARRWGGAEGGFRKCVRNSPPGNLSSKKESPSHVTAIHTASQEPQGEVPPRQRWVAQEDQLLASAPRPTAQAARRHPPCNHREYNMGTRKAARYMRNRRPATFRVGCHQPDCLLLAP